MNRSKARVVTVAYVCFAITGLCCSLPGIILPAWHLKDETAAFLFLTISSGSTLGALLIGRSLRRTVCLGFLFVSIASVGWASLNGGAIPLGLVWGLGLGMIMTALSLMSAVFSTRRAVTLMRLNFLWSLGATVCPIIITPSLKSFGPGSILLSLAGLGIVLAGMTTFLPTSNPTLERERAPMSITGLPSTLVLATVLGPGIEAAAGAWLATYAHRYHGDSHLALELPMLFWGGLFANRMLSWFLPTVLDHAIWLRASLVLTSIASVLLLVPASSVLLCVASSSIGFGLGPLYPQFLSRVLARKNNRLIFFMAGLSSAAIPWATGMVSGKSGSLQLGVIVLALCSFALLASGWQHTKAPVLDTDGR